MVVFITQMTAQFTQICYPGVVSNKADSEGYYASFGGGSNFSGRGVAKLFLGNDVIQSKIEGAIFFSFPSLSVAN